jgi:uncharacterized protein with NRDE domain
MCLLVFCTPNEEYLFAGALNRDEFTDRPTAPLHFWFDHPRVLAGRDLEKGGTWAGITRDGRFSFVTNVRKLPLKSPNKRSRGELVSDFLTGPDESTPIEYLKGLKGSVQEYSPFNLVLGSLQSLVYFSSENPSLIKILEPGIHAVSNAALNTPWPKVTRAKLGFEAALKEADPKRALLEMLQDTTEAPDSDLPDTGVGIDIERRLSPIFLQFKGYGTRSSSVILIRKDGEIDFTEVTYLVNKLPLRRDFRFKL